MLCSLLTSIQLFREFGQYLPANVSVAETDADGAERAAAEVVATAYVEFEAEPKMQARAFVNDDVP